MGLFQQSQKDTKQLRKLPKFQPWAESCLDLAGWLTISFQIRTPIGTNTQRLDLSRHAPLLAKEDAPSIVPASEGTWKPPGIVKVK